MNGIKCQIWINTPPYEPPEVPFSLCADRHAVLPAPSPLPISLMFFSHNKSGPDFLKQTMLWGLSPPITLCQFQSGLKYDSTVCGSPLLKVLPPPPFPLSCPFSLRYPFLRPCSLLNLFPLALFKQRLISEGRRITLLWDVNVKCIQRDALYVQTSRGSTCTICCRTHLKPVGVNIAQQQFPVFQEDFPQQIQIQKERRWRRQSSLVLFFTLRNIRTVCVSLCAAIKDGN